MIAKTKPKGKSKEARAREYALAIYAESCKDLIELIKRMPQRPNRQAVKEMLSARFDVAVDSAEMFDMRWQAVRARFKEEEEE